MRAPYLNLLCSVAAVLAGTAVIGAAETITTAVPAWPDGTPQQVREDVFGLRFREIREIDGPKAGLKFLKREYERNPRPEVKAYMGWVEIFAKGWGYPEMLNQSHGLALVSEAMNEGSITACDVLGRAAGEEIGGHTAPAVAARMLRTAADAGATHAMARLAVFYAFGYGVPANLDEAHRLARRAAELGFPTGLVDLGDAFADGRLGGKPDLDRALQYYYEASCHADADAWSRLKALADKGNEQARMYYALGIVREGNRATWIAPARVREQLKVLTKLAGSQPQALTEIGCVHLDGEFGSRDYTLARDCFTRAAAQGNDEARFYLAKMQLRGWGEKAQPAPAIAAIEALADAGQPEAANFLGYSYYWGTGEVPELKKDPVKAFHYIRLAAEKGHPFALVNLAACYEDGIGTPTNYALAAKMYWQAYLRGYTRGRNRVAKLLAFVK